DLIVGGVRSVAAEAERIELHLAQKLRLEPAFEAGQNRFRHTRRTADRGDTTGAAPHQARCTRIYPMLLRLSRLSSVVRHLSSEAVALSRPLPFLYCSADEP